MICLITIGVNYFKLGKGTANAGSSAGFVAVTNPEGFNPAQVVVIGPNCTSAAGQRTRALIAQLAQARVPYMQTSDFSVTASEDVQGLYRLQEVMQGDAPIVFVHGKAKANPQIQEVIAEYNRAPQR
ncbi:MAG TPA: hypothetical protein V6C64_01390 [Microcoleaceae cyanobacterium]